ncbi:TPA: methyl-accepting chemotaxis protein, partial [Klebsiella pneumoniae]|nr:methyl-accepting chemotaxis protein [Klebsiella pneumoniae]
HVESSMTEILSASEEQTRGISQVSLAVTEMDKATQQNAAMVEQSSAVASLLTEKAGDLEQIVEQFKTAESLFSKKSTLTKPVEKSANIGLSPIKENQQDSRIKEPKNHNQSTFKEDEDDDWTSF